MTASTVTDSWSHGAARHSQSRRLFSLALALSLTGCTAIDLDKTIPSVGQAVEQCVAGSGLAQTNLVAGSNQFRFLLPHSFGDGGPAYLSHVINVEATSTGLPVSGDFAQFAAVGERARNTLPGDLANDDVVKAVVSVIIRSSALAQIAAAKQAGLSVSAQQEAAATSYPMPSSLSLFQLKAFANKVFDHQLNGTVATNNASLSTTSTPDSVFSQYFKAYYEGKYVDRFGQTITKPQISMTIPDAEIAAALTVLLDYVVDLVDPTPVLIDTTTISKTTKFYPGGKTDEPTVLASNLANYRTIPANGCGITTENVVLLTDIANAAGDRAGTLSGMLAGSTGAIEIGFGVLGKLSIGDNQLLTTIVKTAAARLAMRSAFAISYWSISNIDAPGAKAGTNSLNFR